MISNGRSPSRKRTDMSSGPLRGFVADHHDAARSVDLSELVGGIFKCMLHAVLRCINQNSLRTLTRLRKHA